MGMTILGSKRTEKNQCVVLSPERQHLSPFWCLFKNKKNERKLIKLQQTNNSNFSFNAQERCRIICPFGDNFHKSLA